jgi:hypothetical protein
MDKELKKYEKYISSEVTHLQDMDKKEVSELYRYHMDRVRDFQHERLIHLNVTLFFGAVLLASVISYMVFSLSIASTTLYIPIFVLIIILFVVEVFYVRHYYFLENGVQRLYTHTKSFREPKNK